MPQQNKGLQCMLTGLAVGLLATAAVAGDEPPPTPSEQPPSEQPPPDASAPPPPPPPPAQPKRDIEGAIGPVFGLSPDYGGDRHLKLMTTAGFFLRYGRYTISNTSAFVTRRADDVFTGLGVDLKQTEKLRFNFGLRLDRGREASSSESLQGLHDVPTTIRGRASLTQHFEHGTKLSLTWSPDLLGHEGGQLLSLALGHDRTLSPGLTWNVTGSVTWASAQYMRSYYGVRPDETAASGYPVYTPGGGLRDATIGTGWRLDVHRRWVAFWGLGLTHLLGPAADSPVTRATTQWSANGGIAWRF
jgi:MipA family protein